MFLEMIAKVVEKHPQFKMVATTLREVHSTNRHSWSEAAWISGKSFQAPGCELDVLDRVGGRDAFAAEFIGGLLPGEPEQEGVKLGWAHGALLTTFPGDTTMATVKQVRAFVHGGSARIQRISSLSGWPEPAFCVRRAEVQGWGRSGCGQGGVARRPSYGRGKKTFSCRKKKAADAPVR